MEYSLGQSIVWDKELIRHQDNYSSKPYISFTKEWVERPVSEKKGLVIGIRTLCNGLTTFDTESGYTFYPKKYFKALLVVSDLRTNPIYIMIPGKKNDQPKEVG